MADARTNEYLPYSAYKDSMFQANHGYPRHYRPPYRVPYHQQPQSRGYPNVNNYRQRSIHYPPQHARSDSMGYYRPPVYHTGSYYPRYIKQTGKGWDGDPLSYRYDGGKTANFTMPQFSNAKTNIVQTSNAQRQTSTAGTSTSLSITSQTSMAQPSQPQPRSPQPGVSQYSQPQVRHANITQLSIAQARMEQNSVAQISMSPPRIQRTSAINTRMNQSQNSIVSMRQPSVTHNSITKCSLAKMAQVSLIQPTIQDTSTVSAPHVKKGEVSVSQPMTQSFSTSIVTTSIAPPRKNPLSQSSVLPSSVPGINQVASSSLIKSYETPRTTTEQQQTSVSQVQQPLHGVTRKDPSLINKAMSPRNLTHTSTCDLRKTKMSPPTIKQMSVKEAQTTQATEPSIAQLKKAKYSQSQSYITPTGSERQPFLVEYPVSYKKHWKTDSSAVTTPSTVNSDQYRTTKVTSVSECNLDIQNSQPYPTVTKIYDPPCKKVTNGEVKHSNDDQTRIKLMNNDEAKLQNHKKNRWDLKDRDSGKSLLRDKVKLVKSDCKVELVDYIKEFCNSNTEKCLKTEKHLNVQLEKNNHCNIKKNEVDSNHKGSNQCCHKNSEKSKNSSIERHLKSQVLDNGCKVSNNSGKMEEEDDNYKYENNASEKDDGELDEKDAEELLMSMSNRSIRISRLLEEQKRLMASLPAVKYTHC